MNLAIKTLWDDEKDRVIYAVFQHDIELSRFCSWQEAFDFMGAWHDVACS